MYTGTYLNPDNISFKEKINSRIYVDKTDLIKFCNERVCTANKFVCSTRPRRFGKSMAIDMLAAYYSKGCDSKELFDDLNVSKYNMEDEKEAKLSQKYLQYMNAFDVILIDMHSVYTDAGDSDKIHSFLTDRIKEELAEVYPDCIIDDHYLSESLMEIHRVTGKQFIILIDSWDTIFRLDKNNIDAQKEYMRFLCSIFKGSCIEECIALAYMTGILPIKKYVDSFSPYHFEEFTMVSPANMVDYIGFTEDEVSELCEEYDMSFDEMQKWYDGYTLKNKHVYSPNSVCNAIENRRYKDYWVSTETYESLKLYISLNFEGLKDDIITMLACGKVKADVGLFTNDLVSFGSKDEVLACLVHLGYLAYDAKTEEVFIPNKEIRTVFERAIKTSKEFNPLMMKIL